MPCRAVPFFLHRCTYACVSSSFLVLRRPWPLPRPPRAASGQPPPLRGSAPPAPSRSCRPARTRRARTARSRSRVQCGSWFRFFFRFVSGGGEGTNGMEERAKQQRKGRESGIREATLAIGSNGIPGILVFLYSTRGIWRV